MLSWQESDEISSWMSKVLNVIEEYDLTKEEWDSIIEVGQFEGQRDHVASILSKVCTCRSLILVFVGTFELIKRQLWANLIFRPLNSGSTVRVKVLGRVIFVVVLGKTLIPTVTLFT